MNKPRYDRLIRCGTGGTLLSNLIYQVSEKAIVHNLLYVGSLKPGSSASFLEVLLAQYYSIYLRHMIVFHTTYRLGSWKLMDLTEKVLD